MDLSTIELPIWSAALAGLAYTAFAVQLALSGSLSAPGGRAARLLGGAALASAAWGWAGTAGSAWASVVATLDLVRYGLWFAFILSVLAPLLARRGEHNLAWLVPFAVVLLASGAVVLATTQVTPEGSAGRPSLYEGLALALFGVVLVEQLFRNVSEESRWNAKPLCLGLCVIVCFDIYVYSQAVMFREIDADAVSIRPAVHALAVPLLFIASRPGRDWVVRLKVSRNAAFHTAALVLAGVYLAFVMSVGYYIRYFGGTWGAALQLASLFVGLTALAVLAVSGTMRSRLRVFVGKHFFDYRYDYRDEWLRFTTMLSAKGPPSETGTLVIRGMADMVESPSGALWTRDATRAEYVQTARWNSPAMAVREPSDSSLSNFFLRTGWIIHLERYRAGTEHYPGLTLPAWLESASQYWLAIPLIVGDDLLGFVALGPPRTPVDVNWEVTDLLKTASRQAAGFLGQMLATEALLEARKFEAFNRMSAFVVHDLKNIVAQLTLMLNNAKRLHANPEFQRDMLATVENSLAKMRQLMLQLREGEAPATGRGGVELVPLVRRIEAMAAGRGRKIEVRALDDVATRGHETRIERVVGHVVQNALDATQAGGDVWVAVRRASGQVQVEVGDTGVGMSPEFVQSALFKPFSTTKEAGLGIGAYESYQYVRELGGSIGVDSQPGRGTVMTISLPLFEAHAASALQMASAK